jgi:hypothetical protein
MLVHVCSLYVYTPYDLATALTCACKKVYEIDPTVLKFLRLRLLPPFQTIYSATSSRLRAVYTSGLVMHILIAYWLRIS